MNKFSYRVGRIGGVGVALLLAGCQLTALGAQSSAQRTGPAVRITQAASPSALLAVTAGPTFSAAIASLVADTARPEEDIRILQAGPPARMVVASDAPAPAERVISGPPTAPAGSQTAYQSAQYSRKLTAWRAMRAAEVREVARVTRIQVSSWVAHLELAQRISGLADSSGRGSGLAVESAVAASAVAGLQEDAGNVFGSRRVIVLFSADLDAALPAGELTGDDIIVVTSYLPSAAAASAAQAELLGAGAAQATVVGPEVTPAQLDALVSADLSQGAVSDSISTPVMFGNNSTTLHTPAVRQLTQMLARLRKPGMTAVINGYASVVGTARANYLLSYRRAANVAAFFEAHGVPASSLIIVGHGATAAFGTGSSAANRRVLVVSEQAALAS